MAPPSPAADIGGEIDREWREEVGGLCAIGAPEHAADRFQQLRDAGVHDFPLVPQCPWEQYPEQIERMADILLADVADPIR